MKSNDPMVGLKLDLEDAFASVGMTMLSDQKCCMLLAWLLVYGSAQSATTQNKNLVADIKIAQKRLNIYGGETPSQELMLLMNGYVKEAELYDGKTPEWVREIFTKYA